MSFKSEMYGIENLIRSKQHVLKINLCGLYHKKWKKYEISQLILLPREHHWSTMKVKERKLNQINRNANKVEGSIIIRESLSLTNNNMNM